MKKQFLALLTGVMFFASSHISCAGSARPSAAEERPLAHALVQAIEAQIFDGTYYNAEKIDAFLKKLADSLRESFEKNTSSKGPIVNILLATHKILMLLAKDKIISYHNEVIEKIFNTYKDTKNAAAIKFLTKRGFKIFKDEAASKKCTEFLASF